MKRLVWLASYPKSGNTWFRAFLANLLVDAPQPVDINEINVGHNAGSRPALDAVLGYDSSNLTYEEIDQLRREWYLYLGSHTASVRYMKVHDAYALLPSGRPIFPPEVSKAVVYIVRNPLDVCISYAHHAGHDNFAVTVKAMCNPEYTACGNINRFHEQLRQRMLSWSKHVESWLDADNQVIHVMRYEDMKAHPHATFKRVAEFLELPSDDARIAKAIHFSSFEQMRAQEGTHRFRENINANRPFFRKGESGGGRAVLTAKQVEKLTQASRLTMQRLGYEGDGRNALVGAPA